MRATWKSAKSAHTVLGFRASNSINSLRQFDGVLRYADEHGWMFHTFEYSMDGMELLHLNEPTLGGKTDLAELLDFWKPDGCIVDYGAIDCTIPRNAFGKIPVVYLDWSASESHPLAASLSSDSKRIAEVAAHELLALGFADYAFVPAMCDFPWNVERGREFSRLMCMNRRANHVFSWDDGKDATMALRREKLLSWLVALPKPCGVFASNDFVAKNVLDLCRAANIDVPSEIAVLGVDDDPQICEYTTPTLSSIRQDYEHGGYLAGEMLDEMIANPKAKPRQLSYGVARVTKRASMHSCTDKRVQIALEFIRLHACEGIGLDDVIAEMGCSRRFATWLFRQSKGQSILDSIHAVRLARVKELLVNPKQEIKALPDLCGYKSLGDLRRVFKARTGQTMAEFRCRL